MLKFKCETFEKWYVISAFIDWTTFDFDRCVVNVNGQLFTDYTEEFEEVLEAEQIWEQLSKKKTLELI